MDLRFKLAMFISSFLPLWISICLMMVYDFCAKTIKIIAEYHELPPLFASYPLEILVFSLSLGAIFWGCGVTREFLKQEKQPHPAQVSNVSNSSTLMTEFLLAYILPLIAFDFSQLRDLFIFVLCFSFLAVISIKNENIYVNIFLDFNGYKLFRGDVEKSVGGENKLFQDSLIISKKKTLGQVRYFEVCDNIYIILEGEINE